MKIKEVDDKIIITSYTGDLTVIARKGSEVSVPDETPRPHGLEQVITGPHPVETLEDVMTAHKERVSREARPGLTKEEIHNIVNSQSKNEHCPHCGSSDYDIMSEKARICNNCGCGFSTPLAAEVSEKFALRTDTPKHERPIVTGDQVLANPTSYKTFRPHREPERRAEPGKGIMRETGYSEQDPRPKTFKRFSDILLGRNE